MEHTPYPVVVRVTDLGTGEETVEVQIRCGCEVELYHDYGVGAHI